MSALLAPGYSVEIDSTPAAEWCALVSAFSDANLYQVWQDGSLEDCPSNIGRVLLRNRDAVVAVAEVRLITVPLTDRGIAYVFWGPVTEGPSSGALGAFRQMLRALRNEYVIKRGMILRLNPRLHQGVHTEKIATLLEEGFKPLADPRPKRTLVMDITPSLDEVRRSFDKKWRNCLSKAERSQLTVRSGTSVDMIDEFSQVYGRMLSRKRLTPSADLLKHRRAQSRLPGPWKMRVVLVDLHGDVCAGAIYTNMGDTAVYLFGASDGVGLTTSASYLLQWTILDELKAKGTRFYDLNGIDPDGNPGVYHFKRGLAGRLGTEVIAVGQYQAATPSIANASLLLLERLRRRVRTARPRSGRLITAGS